MSRLLIIAVVAACSHHEPQPTKPGSLTSSPEPSTQAVPEDSVTCEAVAAAMIKTGDLGLPAKSAREIIMRHCKDDLWSADARRCVVVTTGDTRAACDVKFSDTQHREFEKDMAAHGITVLHPAPSL
jgi:hypothetical protein